jgi:hypothetical protein
VKNKPQEVMQKTGRVQQSPDAVWRYGGCAADDFWTSMKKRHIPHIASEHRKQKQ